MYNFEKTLGHLQCIIDCIKAGYKILFMYASASVLFRNNRSASAHTDFVAERLSELFELDRIRITPKECSFDNRTFQCQFNITGRRLDS